MRLETIVEVVELTDLRATPTSNYVRFKVLRRGNVRYVSATGTIPIDNATTRSWFHQAALAGKGWI